MSHGPQARAKRAHESRMVQGAATIEMMDLRSGSNEAHLDQGGNPFSGIDHAGTGQEQTQHHAGGTAASDRALDVHGAMVALTA